MEIAYSVTSLVYINYILYVSVCSDTTLAHRGRDAHQRLAYGDLLRRRGEAEEELQAIRGFQEVFAQFGECGVDQYLVRSCIEYLCVCMLTTHSMYGRVTTDNNLMFAGACERGSDSAGGVAE